MEKVRIGNDIQVKYTVLRDGLPESFAGATNIAVEVRNEAYDKVIPSTFSIVDNVVNVVLDAKDCVLCGKHRVTLSYNRGNDITIDALAFELVQFTSLTGGTEIVGIEIVTVNISGDIGIAIPDNNKIDLDGLNSNIRQLKFNTATPVAPTQAGQMAWSDEEKTGVLHNGYHSHPIGKETFFTAKNQSGTLIANGKAVYAIGSTGANATIGLSTTANGDIAQRTIGIATMDIASNGFGDVTTFGEVNDINTSALTEGALVYLGLNGNLTSVEPVAPTPKISLGLCIRSHLTQGRIAVYVRPIARLNKLTDVYAPNLLDGDVLRWNGAALRYEVYNLVNKADLVGGKVPASQLPAYVDDIIEYANLAAFPAVGETGKLYVTLDTNLTYRWSGSAYTEVSKSLAIGITSTTAFRGDLGKTAYDHSLLTNSNPHGTTAAQIANTPAGTISATTVQAAINELDSDIVQVETDLNALEQEQIQGGVYDVSSHNDGAVFEFLSTLLGSANLSTLIPTSVRRGGMSIRFIQGSVPNSDNKYVQYRFMLSGSFTIGKFTSASNWQGVDTEPIYGSMNLITSGGVQTRINDIEMYNVTEKNSGTKYSSLSDAIQAIPISDRKTNMCIKYMNTLDLFVRYTYMKEYANTTTGNNNFLNVANWQGISDEVPTDGSHNAVESGTIFNEIKGFAKKTDSVVCGGSGLITQSGNTIKIANSTFLYNVGVSYYIKFHTSALYVEYNISYSNCLVLDVSKIDTTKTSANNPSVASEIPGLISVISKASITKGHIILVGNNFGKVYGALARWKIDFDEKFNRVFDSIRVVAPVYSDRNGHVKIPSLYLPELFADINHKNGVSTLGKINYIEFDLATTLSNSCIYLDLSKFYYENNSVLNSIVTRSAYVADAYNSGLVLLLARTKSDINGWPSYKGCLSNYVVFEDSLTVFNRYGEQFNELNFLTKKGYRSSKNNLSFGWISDGHGNTLFDANVAIDNSPADFLIYTGDMSISDYNSPVDTLISEAVAMTKPVYFVIGNHDQWKAPSLDALYDRWISPLATKDSITTGELYYSIDFSAKGVKCIFLNDVDVEPSNTNYMYSVYSQAQIEWLVSELKTAATNNLHVAIFRHYPAFNGTVENEVWTERHFKSSPTFGDNEVLTPDSNGVSSWNPIPYIIKAWVEKGAYSTTYNGFTISADFSNEANNGIFIGYFNGHTHGDSVIKNTTLNQLNIGITQPNTYQERTDLWKNITYYHEINFVQIDTNNREIHIMRLGQRNTYNSYVRDFLCVEY